MRRRGFLCGGDEQLTDEHYEISSFIQTLCSHKRRVVTTVYKIIKKRIIIFYNDLPEDEIDD